ncbi:hypothetical protein NKR23_g8955 [Pleurostoma richardsiae]|uniref:Uncharacterized protein n=1 Tax=Pleurostoma richardsiae TaxID=41990 RepID=A0AA38VKA7_9PEZI|nr:hypothetical protein NKR23_g8955 [Pleurostoma richardsiae]
MAASKLLAREIAAYDDAELDRYLEESGRLVRVQDPENLPESFIQRLRDRVNVANDTTRSDLNQVSARLLQISTDRRAPPENSEDSSSASLSAYGTPDPEDENLRKLAEEREDHDALVNDGGRPWYPVHLLEEVSKHPREHSGLLRAWQPYPDAQPDDWMVFGRQLLRWHLFREWQRRRRKQFEGRIAEYTQWARIFLLNTHSYTAPVEFEFNEDPKKQDQLTTWIEYLAYEHNFYSCRYAWYKRREKWYEAQWNKLVDSGVLGPRETYEFIWNDECTFQHETFDLCTAKIGGGPRQVGFSNAVIRVD